jgi:hypothetical protein
LTILKADAGRHLINRREGAAGGQNLLYTSRIRVQAPLFVYGYTGDNPFHEEACTVEINAHGGLISMQTAVRPGQKLLVMNKGDESSQQCVILSVRVRQERAFDVGFEFHPRLLRPTRG